MMTDVVIVGGGPAGLAAGMYLARGGWKTLLFEKDALGGQARHIERIENYPGFPSGVSGKILMRRFADQAKRWKLKVIRSQVKEISRGRSGFQIASDAGIFAARSVISCAGAVFRKLGIAGEDGFQGRGAHHCAFGMTRRCAGKIVAVAGGGDAAVHQALLLARRAKKVFLIHRGGHLKAITPLQRKIFSRRNVEFLPRTIVRRIYARRGSTHDFLDGIEVQNGETATRKRLPVSAIFVLIGKEPGPRLARWRKPPPGFFVAGDSNMGIFRQVVVASGDGVRAAMECERHLLNPCAS